MLSRMNVSYVRRKLRCPYTTFIVFFIDLQPRAMALPQSHQKDPSC